MSLRIPRPSTPPINTQTKNRGNDTGLFRCGRDSKPAEEAGGLDEFKRAGAADAVSSFSTLSYRRFAGGGTWVSSQMMICYFGAD